MKDKNIHYIRKHDKCGDWMDKFTSWTVKADDSVKGRTISDFRKGECSCETPTLIMDILAVQMSCGVGFLYTLPQNHCC